MSVYCLLNNEKYKVPYEKFYNPLLLIDVKRFQLKCNLTNSLLFFIENPRHNIELVSGFFEFYFKSIPDEYTLGQVISKTMILYSKESSHYEFMPCILFTSGFFLQEILIYLPLQNFPFHRQLKYYFFQTNKDQCIICLEDNIDCYNVHQDKYKHNICKNCILKIDSICPICRLPII